MIRRIPEDLSALFGSAGRPAISAVTSWGCAALAYPLATRGGYAGAVVAALLFSLLVFLLAFLLSSGALAFVFDARRSCLPGSQRLEHRAILLAAVLLLPALVLTLAALAGNPVWPTRVPAVLVLAVALAGALAPRRAASAVGLLLLVVLAACWAAKGSGHHELSREWLLAFFAAVLVLFVAAFPLSVAIEWRRAMRGSRTRSLTLEHALRTACSGRGSRERRPPAQIVRTCIGDVFVQTSRQLIVGAMVMALFVASAIGLPWFGANGWRWAITALAIIVAGLLLSRFLSGLRNFTRGQLAELALMPGLGAPSAQRRALCRAVLTPPLMWLGVLLLFGCADLLLKGEPLSSVGMLAVCLAIMWLTYSVVALQKLTTLPPKRQSYMSELMLLYLLIYLSGNYYWVFAAHPEFRPWFWLWITPALLGVGISSAIAFSVRRLLTAPHPFLCSDSANSRMNM